MTKAWYPQAVRSKLIIARNWSDVAQGKSGGLICWSCLLAFSFSYFESRAAKVRFLATADEWRKRGTHRP